MYDTGSMDSRSQRSHYNSPRYTSSLDSRAPMDDEHRLIARYAARLAAENPVVSI